MKNKIEWHEENLNNSRKFAHKLQIELNNIQDKLTRTLISNMKLSNQIEEAKNRGLTEFDGDRFLKPRK